MSAFDRVTRSLPDGHEITILTPGRRRWGSDGPKRRRGWAGADPGGGSHAHAAIEEIAVQTHSPEVSMHDR
jgi:hypothetical protein